MRKLEPHPDGRTLCYEDGEPFFLLADTAWELFHRLTREEALYYLTTRARQGFNAVQAVALAEFEGATQPSAQGHLPLKNGPDGLPDPTLPDDDGKYSYWDHVDYVIRAAESLGLYVMLLPTWGDKFNKKWGAGPEIFTPENAYIYGKWIGKRYAGYTNMIWMLGGDRPLETDRHHEIIEAMGRGIRESTGGDQLITFHPCGWRSSVDDVAGCDFIDFHTVQSSHGVGGYRSWELVRRTGQAEKKPFMESESRYEDHPACFNANLGYYWDAADARQNWYWNLCEGECGQTYGNHCIWGFNREKQPYFPLTWQEAIIRPGATQFKHLATLRLSRPFAEFRAAPELIEDDEAAMAHQCAGRGEKYAFCYSPLGLPMRVHLGLLADEKSYVKASWFDPRTGNLFQPFALLPPGDALCVPPSSGKGQDWVLVLDVVG